MGFNSGFKGLMFDPFLRVWSSEMLLRICWQMRINTSGESSASFVRAKKKHWYHLPDYRHHITEYCKIHTDNYENTTSHNFIIYFTDLRNLLKRQNTFCLGVVCLYCFYAAVQTFEIPSMLTQAGTRLQTHSR
jgi:hypothetical protein